tara:strand:- start:620 stop:1270 length:651 start_codon:yes stop_codon:yes gene_type:complete
VIKQISLEHKGGFYFYGTHNLKCKELTNGFSPLLRFLEKMFGDCPNDYFNSGPRSSSLKFGLNNLKLTQITGHEVSDLAKHGLEINKERYKSNHMRVQMFMLENDNKTISVEVPIWIKREEIDNYKGLFDSYDKPLSGHIDILRIEDRKIWIWDYKPNAHKEKYAATQVFFYALMLSKRTGINIDHFRCGYFDSFYAYIFKPELNYLDYKSLKDFC